MLALPNYTGIDKLFMLDLFTTSDNQPIFYIQEHNVHSQLFLTTAMGANPFLRPLTCESLSCELGLYRPTYCTLNPIHCNFTTCILNYDTSAGMSHPIIVPCRHMFTYINKTQHVPGCAPTCPCSGARHLLLPRCRRPQRLRCCFRRVCDYHRPAASWTW